MVRDDFFMMVSGLVHSGVGVTVTAYAALRDTVERRSSYDTLTSGRAIFGLFDPWAARSVSKFRIGKKTTIRMRHGHTAAFGQASRMRHSPFPTPAPQFTRIDDTEKVYHLMQQIQKETP